MGSEWQVLPLKDVLAFVADNRGKNPEAYTETGIPVIDNYLITSEWRISLYDARRFIDEDTYNSFIRKHIEEDDVLVTLVGNGYGQVAIAPSQRCVIIQNTIGLRCNKDNDNKFLYYLLKANRPSLMNLNIGAAQPSIKVGNLLDLTFSFPCLDQQKSIAYILGTLDDKIELNREINTTLESMAQALFKSWFVDFDPVIDNALAAGNDIPDALQAKAAKRKALGANRKPLPDGLQQQFPDRFVFTDEMGWVPEGWRAGPISNLAKLNPESWTAKKHPEYITYVDLANTKDGRITDTTDYEFSQAPSRARRVLRAGDTIVGTVRPGNRSFAYVGDDNLTGSTGFAVMRPTEQCHRSFVYLSLTQDETIRQLAHLADGAAYPAIRPEVVASHVVTLPPPQILSAFDTLTFTMLSTIEQNEVSNGTLASLRDTLLPKLLSGELRIPEAGKQLAEAL